MATLHSVTDGIKTLFKISILLLFLILFTVLIFKMKDVFFPAQKPAPEQAFGALPTISFPQSSQTKPTTYTLDTVTGSLPVFSDRIDVYKITPVQSSLLAAKKASDTLSSAGFKQGPQAVSETIYQYTDIDPPERKILYNIFSSNFQLQSSFFENPDVISATRLGTEADAKSTAENFLQQVRAYPSDLDPEKTKTTLFSINNNTLIPASSLSTAQIIQVEFFQKDKGGIPIVYPKPISPMNLFVGSTKFNPLVLSGLFFHQEISEEKSQYPLITAQNAFDTLKNGDAYIVSNSQNAKTISIKNIYLAYYIGETEQEYAFPVVVFEGDNGFIAYVPAIQ